MFYYKITAKLEKADESEEQKVIRPRDKSRILAEKICLETEGYNDRPLERYIFTAHITDKKAVCGVFSNEKVDTQWILSYLEVLEIKHTKIIAEEITFSEISSLISKANRGGYVEDDDEILEKLKLYTLRRYNDDFEMVLEEEHSRKGLLKQAKEILSSSLEEELQRIFASHTEKLFFGHPVHYILETDSREECKKMLCIQEMNDGRGVVFATGTPLCNSISDAYAMQMYLQYDELKQVHLDQFDNWVKTFAKPERVCEIDVDTSKFRFVNRFARFFNLPELSKMFSSIAAFHTVEEQGLPQHNGYEDVLIRRNFPLQEYMNSLCERTEKIRSKDVDKTKDNMLKVSTDGRKAALDLRLVGDPQAYDETSKIYSCVQNVMDIYRKNDDYTQIIFCDISTPKANAEKFDVYNELKMRLVGEGVPIKEIAFVHSYQTEARKVQLYQDVNDGKVRILIGSTFKLGIGANVQTRLKAIHHLDVPWRPADMVQREGRILRKGNTNDSVMIFRYVAEGSFDAYSWQILEAKQRFISQFLGGSGCERTASDLEENVLTYAQVKALAISEPLMKNLAEKQNELKRLQILSSGFSEEQKKISDSIKDRKEKVRRLEKRYADTLKNEEDLLTYSEVDFKKEYVRIKDIFTTDIIFGKEKLNDAVVICGFSVIFPQTQDAEKPYLYLERSDARYIIKSGDSSTGNARRIINFLKNFHNASETVQQQKENAIKELDDAKKALAENNPYHDQIECLKQEVEKLKQRLQY